MDHMSSQKVHLCNGHQGPGYFADTAHQEEKITLADPIIKLKIMFLQGKEYIQHINCQNVLIHSSKTNINIQAEVFCQQFLKQVPILKPKMAVLLQQLIEDVMSVKVWKRVLMFFAFCERPTLSDSVVDHEQAEACWF